MKSIIEFNKTLQIFHFWLFTVLMPLAIGALIGIIAAKIKPNALKWTLIATAAVSVTFISIVLLTLQDQFLPMLAILIAVTAIIIMNVSAAIAHKIVSSRNGINK